MTTPAAWLVAGSLWLGCLLPGHWGLAPAGLVTILPAVRGHSARRRLVLLAVAMAALGSGSAAARSELLDLGPLARLAADGGVGAMQAVVVTDARPSRDGAWYVVRVATLDGLAVGRRGLLRAPAVQEAPELGARIRFDASARPLDDEGFGAYLRRLHTAVSLSPVGAPVTVEPPPMILRATSTVRSRVRAAAAAHLPADQAALLSGLVTGDTLGLSEAAEDDMLASGLTHLVAVSGANVALVLGGTIGAAALVGLGARGRRRAAVVALVWFAVLVRGEPSVLRASVMALLVIAAQASGRGSDARHTLAAATILLLLVDPFLAGQLGFALSVLATAGVLLVGPAMAARLPGPRPLSVLVGATTGAQAAVAPVLLATEGGLPLGALPANLVAVPAAAVASAVGVCAALVAQVIPTLGAFIAALAGPATAVVLWAGRTFAEVPAVSPHHLLSPLTAVVVLAVVARRRHPAVAAGGLVLVVAMVLGAPTGRAPAVDGLQITAFAVGQGDALLVEVPPTSDGPPARMLVDGGPDERATAKLLRSLGVGYLDAVAVSHPHADHTDGLPQVLSRIPVGALVVGPTPARALDDVAASAMATEAVAARRGVRVLRVAAGQRFHLGEARVEVLSPPADGSLGTDPNENSLVLRVTSPDGALLLTGDVEEEAQRRLLARPDRLAADVLKVPHHGGNTNADGFFEAVGAHTAVIGVGADNDYGHPHPAVLEDLAGTTVLRTDTDGSVTAAAEPGQGPLGGASALP